MTDTGIPYHRIASQFYNRPLLVLPSTAETISAFLLSRIGAGPRAAAIESDAGLTRQAFNPTPGPDGSMQIHSARASRFYGDYPMESDGSGRPMPFRRTPEGVGICSMIGEFVNRGAWVGASSGLISYEGLKYQVQRAGADPKTRAIVLDLESPGGEAIGCFEAAAVVREVAKTKDVVAIVNGMACSAAYAIASGASRIVNTPSGVAGSIGVVMMHLDFSQALQKEGVKPTLIYAGAHKVDGNPFEPLPEDVRAEMQAACLGIYDQFIATVAAGRPSLSDKQIRGTEARVYRGTDAVDAGLADAVGSFEEVLTEMSRGTQSRSIPSSKGFTMDNKQSAPAANVAGNDQVTTTAQLRSAFPALCTEIAAEASALERNRILAIDAAAMTGHELIVSSHKADPSKTAGDVALAINAAIRGKAKAHMAALATDEVALNGLKSEPAGVVEAGKITLANAADVALKAQAYIDAQAKNGAKVTAADAVAHVTGAA
jgi:signal peptide peptidase SppA